MSVSLALVLTRRWHEHLTADAPGSGPQKLHATATPRVGGIAIAVGFVVAVVVARLQLPDGNQTSAPPWFTGWLIVALFIPLAAGLVEDLTKSLGARYRLLATFFGAAVAYFFCDASLTRFDVPLLDALLASSPVARIAFTMFCVGAIANAYNLADGLNGLLAGLSVAACAAMSWVAWQHGDQFLMVATASLAAAAAGFAVFNFPRARLFAGDGGAYLLGSAISIFAILLCHRHADISPWFVFALVLYPFVDTTAAIVRRLVAGRPVMEPDAEHLHTLLARRLENRFGSIGRNLASTVIVCVSAVTAALAVRLRHETLALIAVCAALSVGYVATYLTIRARAKNLYHDGASDTRDIGSA